MTIAIIICFAVLVIHKSRPKRLHRDWIKKCASRCSYYILVNGRSLEPAPDFTCCKMCKFADICPTKP